MQEWSDWEHEVKASPPSLKLSDSERKIRDGLIRRFEEKIDPRFWKQGLAMIMRLFKEGFLTPLEFARLEAYLLSLQATSAHPHPLLKMPVEANSLIGSLVGNYVIIERLGKGGMGVVYRARHQDPDWAITQGGDVALKWMHAHLACQPKFRKRFVKEAGIGRDFRHPMVVRIHEVIADGVNLVMVMDLIEGESLSQKIRQHSMTMKQMLQLIVDLGTALDALHDSGIVHRDLKPSNVMLQPDGRPVILDLGIAKSVDQQDQTLTGSVVGTPKYMAPEQLDAKYVDGAADRYALGLLFYRLLAGQLPWPPNTSPSRISVLKLTEQLTPLHKVVPDCPAGLSKIVMKMLAYMPHKRPSTCQQWTHSLQSLQFEEGLNPVQGTVENLPVYSHRKVAFEMEESTFDSFSSGNQTFPSIDESQHSASRVSEDTVNSLYSDRVERSQAVPHPDAPKRGEVYPRMVVASVILALLGALALIYTFVAEERDVMVTVGSHSTIVDAWLGPVMGECSGGRCFFANVPRRQQRLSLMIDGCSTIQQQNILVKRGEGLQEEEVLFSCKELRDVTLLFANTLPTGTKVTVDGMPLQINNGRLILRQIRAERYYLKIRSPECSLFEYSFDVRAGTGVQEMKINTECVP